MYCISRDNVQMHVTENPGVMAPRKIKGYCSHQVDEPEAGGCRQLAPQLHCARVSASAGPLASPSQFQNGCRSPVMFPFMGNQLHLFLLWGKHKLPCKAIYRPQSPKDVSFCLRDQNGIMWSSRSAKISQWMFWLFQPLVWIASCSEQCLPYR